MLEWNRKKVVSNFQSRIVFPLDFPTLEQILMYVQILKGHVGIFKIGLEALWNLGPKAIVGALNDAGAPVFIDGKIHDIPNTVKGAMAAVASMENVLMVNMHLMGASSEEIRAFVDAAEAISRDTIPLGVTVLTSTPASECEEAVGATPGILVPRLTLFGMKHGIRGIIASGQECRDIRWETMGRNLDPILVIPGIRPEWASTDDQKRVTTPAEAITFGADFEVVGRPIAKYPKDKGGPQEGARLVNEEINAALARQAA